MPLHRLYDTKEEAKEHIAGPSEPGGAIPPTLQILTGIKRNQNETELNNADADAMCYKTVFWVMPHILYRCTYLSI